jgi:hypothetical protein
MKLWILQPECMTDSDVYIGAVQNSGTEEDKEGQCLSIGVLSKCFTAMKVLSGPAYGQLEMLLAGS